MIDSAKLLFLISNDFGELANAIYFITGYDWQNIFLLPPRLFQVNSHTLPGQIYSYTSVDDVRQIVEREKPDLIFLFSGYLYAINQIFSLKEVAELINYLAQCDRPIITSDPFLGALSAINDRTFSPENPHQQLFQRHFSQVYSLLCDRPHLYPVPFNSTSFHQSFSFFNPHFFPANGEVENYTNKLAQWMAIDPQQQRWLFILSSEDYVTQVNIYGRDKFNAILVAKLHQTMQAERQPILIAPKACIAAIKNSDRENVAGAILISFCNYSQFITVLLEAEYLFVWNIFSNCLIARIGSNKPLFFCDRGHMARAMPAVFQLGLQYNYANVPLVYLDKNKPLTLNELAKLVPQQRQNFDRIRERFKSSPSPQEIVRKLMDN